MILIIVQVISFSKTFVNLVLSASTIMDIIDGFVFIFFSVLLRGIDISSTLHVFSVERIKYSHNYNGGDQHKKNIIL